MDGVRWIAVMYQAAIAAIESHISDVYINANSIIYFMPGDTFMMPS